MDAPVHILTARLTVLWLRGESYMYVWPWMLTLVDWVPIVSFYKHSIHRRLLLNATKNPTHRRLLASVDHCLVAKRFPHMSPSVTLDETSGLFWTKNSGSPRRSFSSLTAVIISFRTVSQYLFLGAAADF